MTRPSTAPADRPHEPAGRGSDTREELLAAAEHLFAERGIARTSLRAITRAAGANLASVNYHFQSKDGLVRAVFHRRLGPINRERLAHLEACLPGDGAAPEVEAIVRAFVTPPLALLADRESGVRDLARLVGRAFSETEEGVRDLLIREFGEVIERFTAALRRALPALPPEAVYWRFHFMVGAMAHTVANAEMVGRLSGGRCDPSQADALTAHLVAFLVGGVSAAPSPRAARRRRRLRR